MKYNDHIVYALTSGYVPDSTDMTVSTFHDHVELMSHLNRTVFRGEYTGFLTDVTLCHELLEELKELPYYADAVAGLHAGKTLLEIVVHENTPAVQKFFKTIDVISE